jgi:hypothetical protein
MGGKGARVCKNGLLLKNDLQYLQDESVSSAKFPKAIQANLLKDKKHLSSCISVHGALFWNGNSPLLLLQFLELGEHSRS